MKRKKERKTDTWGKWKNEKWVALGGIRTHNTLHSGPQVSVFVHVLFLHIAGQSSKSGDLKKKRHKSVDSNGCPYYKSGPLETLRDLSLVCLSIHISINLSIYLSIHPSIYPSIYISSIDSIHPSIYLSVCVSIILGRYSRYWTASVVR